MTRVAIRNCVLAAIGVAGLAGAATALGAPPYRPSAAQMQAELACRSQNVTPESAAWELCLSYVTRAFDWGEPALALQLAHAAGKARETCLDNGREGTVYQTCVDRELEARGQLLVLGDETSDPNIAEVHQ